MQKIPQALLITTVALSFGLDFLNAADNESRATQTNQGPQTTAQFEPYQFLVGEWDVKQTENGPTAAIIRVRWGPNRSYIWYSSSLLFGDREEPHLEGMLVWNGVHNNLDMLFSMDLKAGRVQEQGTMAAAPDDTVIRDITAVYGPGVRSIGMPPAGPEGATVHFRETYKKISADKILTSAMRQTENGWVATFPGSDHLVMIRKAN